MEDHIHQKKLKFKLKLSKPLDHHHHHDHHHDQEHKLKLHHHKQEQASFQLNHHQEIIGDHDLDNDIEEGEIREEEEEEEVRDQEQEHEQEQEPENNQKKFCPHCGKEFKNGKALGGHLRIHADNSGRSDPKVKESGSNPNPNPNPNPGKTVVCNICGKKFPSEKSLYGHMRSHPNRGYRGMNPPPGSNPHGPDPPGSDHDSGSNSDDVSSDQLGAPSVKGMIGWTVKGRRGRSLGSPVDPSEVSSSTTSSGRLAEVAAGELMVLASGEEGEKKVEVRSNYSTLEEKNNNNNNNDDEFLKIKLMKKLDEFDDDELYYLQDVLGISYNSTTSTNISANNSTPLNKNSSNFDYFHPNKTLASFVTSQKVINKSGGDKIVSKKRKIIKDCDESLEVVANHHYDAEDNDNDNHNDDVRKKEFKCTTCGKTFVTHQALGGHRSSHNKERPNHHSRTLNPNSAQAQAQAQTRIIDNGPSGSGSAQLDHGEEIMMGGILHKCKICNQGFPSGQALGGHQRCHYSGQSTDSSPGQSSSQTGRQGMIHGLDLNVIMQENCEDEGEIDIESTYNS